MSLPSFPSRPGIEPPQAIGGGGGGGRGAGDHLPGYLLFVCGICTVVATVISIGSIVLQLKNYRMPALQRCVVRIMVMVPLYALSSFIALYSLDAAFYIDAIRDLYEAFVIYAFLQLLLTYLGGERDLLLRLRGRPPIPHLFPIGIFLSPLDPSDPWTLLNLKRGVLQYVQIKPLLVVVTAILKVTGHYHEGDFKFSSGYTWVTIVYNISICLSLYCLGMFWIAVNKDLKPFRPVPKFLCVKGILFFSFWQGVAISFFVSVGLITKVGPYVDPEHMSLALVDSMICIEMPFFAIAHQYAFQASDYIDTSVIHVARLPFIYAFRDAFGVKDVWEDIKYTFRARGVSYKAYEAADGGLHHDEGRQKRIRAGLRYSRGGKAKYWIQVPGEEQVRRGTERSPLLPQHSDARFQNYDSDSSDASEAASLDFSSMSESEDALYERARRIGYAGFPNVDVSREQARRRRRQEEDGILAGIWTRRGPDTQHGDEQPASETNGHERRSTRIKRTLKGKGKSKDANPRVYGAWADRVSASMAQVPELRVEDAAFDGENENPGAWAADNDGTGMRWARKPAPKAEAKAVTPRKPKPRPLSPEPERQRSDAVDLVSPTDIERSSSRGKLRETEVVAVVPAPAPPPPGPATVEPSRTPTPPSTSTHFPPSPPDSPVHHPPSPPSPPASPPPSHGRSDARDNIGNTDQTGDGNSNGNDSRASPYRWTSPDDNPWA